MKKLIVVCVMFVLGGGVGALWFLKVPPFAKHPKKAVASTAKTAKPAAPAEPEVAKSEKKDDPATIASSDKPAGAGSAVTQPSQSQSPEVPHGSLKPQQPALSEPDLNRMAAVYEQMPVEEAAKILAKLPDNVVEPLLRRMDEKQVGKLLTTFPAERSAKLTVSMTGSSTALAASP